MKATTLPGLILIFLTGATGLSPAAEQPERAAPVFEPALDESLFKLGIPVLLPSRLPDEVGEESIECVTSRTTEDEYRISLYFEYDGICSSYAAGFAGSRDVVRGIPNTRPVVLANGTTAEFRPVSCGGSCAPANLWWEQGGVQYQIQISLRSTMSEPEQERIILEAANANVVVKEL